VKIFGIVGHSGMGKTTLLEKLIPELMGRGLRVSLIKHSHKALDIDHPGKDSHRLREAGCNDVIVIGRARWAAIHELRDEAEPTLDELLAHLRPCDVLLIEGMKQGPFPKIEVWRTGLDRQPLWPQLPGVVAVAGDSSADSPGPLFRLDDVIGIADFVTRYGGPHGDARTKTHRTEAQNESGSARI
jgi:molybdopterin-guanine dinucleotide biosynthesis protein B